MRKPPLGPELRELLDEGKHDELRELLDDFHPRDAAEILTCLEPIEIVQIMSVLPLELERDMFMYLEPELQEQIAVTSGKDRVKQLLAALPGDDRSEFLDELDERVRNQLVRMLPAAAQTDLARREKFEDDQVGSVMSTEFCVLAQELRPQEALDAIRRQAPSKETIYYSYVVDYMGRLIGFVSLRDLMVAEEEQPIREFMKTDVISVRVDADQEEAAQLVRDYDLIALPVTDSTERLVGLVTHDDAIDILEEEATEDIEQFAGITVSQNTEHEDYMDRSVGGHFRTRLPWLATLAASFLFIAALMTVFEQELDGQGLIITAFLPLILATGANVGGQASALVLRGLATGALAEVSVRTVIWKELRIGLTLAGALSVVGLAVTAVWVWLFSEGRAQIGHCLTIAVALALHVIAAAGLGALIPMSISKMGKSPEVFSHPALNAVADTVAVIIYLLTVRALLPVFSVG